MIATAAVQMPWYTQPDWWTAIGTLALVAITGLAVFFGKRAADAAMRAFRLESEPVIVIRGLDREESPPKDPARLLRIFVVSGKPLITDGIELRPYRPSDAGHGNAKQAVINAATIELHNVGRSPALDVRVPFSLRTLILLDERVEESEDARNTGSLEGAGEITVDGIAANGYAYIMLDNLVGGEVTLKAADFGFGLRPGFKKPERIPLVCSGEVVLPGPF